jgi:hypothetical protein
MELDNYMARPIHEEETGYIVNFTITGSVRVEAKDVSDAYDIIENMTDTEICNNADYSDVDINNIQMD